MHSLAFTDRFWLEGRRIDSGTVCIRYLESRLVYTVS